MKLHLAALAAFAVGGALEAQTYEPVADWLEMPAARETLGPMHGDIAVSRAGDVYVSIETAGMGLQVFSADGRYLRSLANAPADLHGFVMLDKSGNVVTHVGTNTDGGIGTNRVPPEQWRTGRIIAAHGVATNGAGDLFVAEFSTFGRVHKVRPR